MNSLGVIETRGLTAAIQAADAACKAASVEIIGYRKIGSGLVSICFQGEISAIRTAIDSGIAVVNQTELVIGSLVIARPEPSIIEKLLTHKSHSVVSPMTVEVAKETTEKVSVDPIEHTIALETKVVTEHAENHQKEVNKAEENKTQNSKSEHNKKENQPESRKGKK